MDNYPGIFALCNADPAVVSLLGDSDFLRLYPAGQAPQDDAKPYAVFQVVGGNPENYVDRRPDIERFTVQVDAYARSATQCRAVAAAIRDAIELSCHITGLFGDQYEQVTGLYRLTFQSDWFVPRRPSTFRAVVGLDDNNQEVDVASTAYVAATVELDDTNQIVDATGYVAAAATITAIGSGLTITNNNFPRLAVLTSSLFAYHDQASDQLRAYSANTGTGAVAQSGSNFSLSSNYSAIVGMGTDWIATHIHNGTAGSLRRHNWSGSSWSQASTTANINLDPSLIKVNATTVLLFGAQESGTFVWGGSNFSLLTSNVPTSGAGVRFGCYLEDNKIALFSGASPNYNLETWQLTGTTWSKVGNTLYVPVANTLDRSSVTALTSTRIVSYWGGSAGGRMARIYDFNGTDWSLVAEQQIGSQTASRGAVAALGANHFVHIDDVLDKLQIYSVT